MPEKSLSEKLHARLEDIIANAQPGEQLPSEPKLADKLGVSRATLREAMRTFETQGLLRRRQGVGTFVVRPSQVIDSGLEVLESIETMAEKIGLNVSMGECKIKNCQASQEAAERLNVPPGTALQCISRVILAEDRPVAFLVDTLKAGYLAPEALGEKFTGSVLDLLLKSGDIPLEVSRCHINAVAADTEVARALDIQRGDSVLRFESRLFNDTGEPIDYSFSYFLPGYFDFHVIRKVG